MSINVAPFISKVPFSDSNRPYREPKLHEVPKGNSEEIEGLRRRVNSANRRILFPDGND